MDDEQPVKLQSIPQQMNRHPWAIWLWLLPVICVAATPILVLLFTLVAMFTGATIPGEAWQIAGVALGIVSGMLIGVGAAQAVAQ